jgi:hypothetical protein
MENLTKNDYHSILKYYKINVDENMSNDDIKKRAENILASKLCKCIKKVDKNRTNESRAIALCRNTVIQRKGFDIFKFTCKNKARLIPKKNTKITLIKRKINKKNKRTSRKNKK